MSDLLRFEIWQVFLVENICDVCLRMHGRVEIAVLVQELLLRPSGNGSVNFVIVHFSFALSEGYNFYIFFVKLYSSSIFTSTSNGVSYLALINRFEGLKMRCS